MKRFLAFASTAILAAIALTIRVASVQPTIAQSLPAQFQSTSEPVADTRVKQVLETLDLAYSVEENGDYRLVVEFDDGRSQAVWITSGTQTLGSLELRQLVSPAYYAEGTLSAQVANRLLQENANKKLGAWQTFQDDEKAIALFTARIDADSSADDFMAALAAVLSVADKMEAELGGSDRF